MFGFHACVAQWFFNVNYCVLFFEEKEDSHTAVCVLFVFVYLLYHLCCLDVSIFHTAMLLILVFHFAGQNNDLSYILLDLTMKTLL